MSAAQTMLDPSRSLLFTARTKIRDRVESLLELGETPEEVAKSLTLNNVWGVPRTTRFFNPIVRLIRQELADASKLEITDRGTLRIVLRDGWDEDFPLPSAVVEFLDAFNRDEFPELEVLGNHKVAEARLVSVVDDCAMGCVP